MEPHPQAVSDDLPPRRVRLRSERRGPSPLSLSILVAVFAAGAGTWSLTQPGPAAQSLAVAPIVLVAPAAPGPGPEEATASIAVVRERAPAQAAVAAEAPAPPVPAVPPQLAAAAPPVRLLVEAGAASQPRAPIVDAEAQAMLAKAKAAIATGDIGAARLLLDRAVQGESAEAAFASAETYDPAMLARWRVRGIKPDPARARALYQKAQAGGVAEAGRRLAAMAP